MSSDPTKAIILSSPSGGGKSTIIRHIIERHANFIHSVSATTREPRATEVDGREYRFMAKEDFQGLINDNALAEWALVHGEWYGTPLSSLREYQSRGLDIIFDLDVVGTAKMKRVWPQILTIYLQPPSREELERRLRDRKSETEQKILYRLERYDMEQKAAGRYDFQIINATIEDTVRRVLECIAEWPHTVAF